MNASWCKIASNLDTHPKIRRAGRNGREVYLFALRRNAEPHHRTPGRIAVAQFEPWYVGDMLQMSEAEAQQGIESCERAKLLKRDEDHFVIVGWDETEWGREKSTDRVRKWRENHKNNGNVPSVPDETNPVPETLRNVADGSGNKRNNERNAMKRMERRDQIRSEEIRSDDPKSIAEESLHVGGAVHAAGDDALSSSESEAQEAAHGDSSASAGEHAAEDGKMQQRAAHRVSAPISRPPEAPLPALTVATMLMEYVVQNAPQSKLARCTDSQRELTLAVWAHDMRLMHEVDHVSYEELQTMVHWSQRHTFWRSVVISAKAMREQWDKMHAQKHRPKRAQTNAETAEEVAARRERERLAQEAKDRAERDRLERVNSERAEVEQGLAELKANLGIGGSSPEPQPVDTDTEESEES